MERGGRTERSVRRISRSPASREPRAGEVPTLGALIRRVRETLGMSREELGEPGLGEMFVAAIERGAVRPSPPALKALAERLNLPVEKLLGCRTRLGRRDLRAYERDLAYQLDLANWMLHDNRIADALACIEEAEAHAARYLPYLSPRVTYRIPYLRGKAHSMARRPADAQRELERTLRLLSKVRKNVKDGGVNEEENVTALIQAHNLLGVSHYIQGHLKQALQQHLRCRRLLADYSVANTGVRLGIYRNLANDYWASGDFPRAISTYKEALELFEDLSDLQRKAGVHWGLAMCYKELGDLVFAAVHARQAIDLYMEAGAWGLAASMRVNLAEVLIENARYREAEDNLNEQSRWLQEPVPPAIWPIEEREKPAEQEAGSSGAVSGDTDSANRSSEKPEAGLVHIDREDILVCGLYMNYARLAWERSDLGRAAEYVVRSLEAGEHAVVVTAQTGEARGYSARIFAEALGLAARIQEDTGDTDGCDRLFEHALSMISTTEFAETHKSISLAYARVLEAREDYKRASKMYRLAASKSDQVGSIKQ